MLQRLRLKLVCIDAFPTSGVDVFNGDLVRKYNVWRCLPGFSRTKRLLQQSHQPNIATKICRICRMLDPKICFLHMFLIKSFGFLEYMIIGQL